MTMEEVAKVYNAHTVHTHAYTYIPCTRMRARTHTMQQGIREKLRKVEYLT